MVAKTAQEQYEGTIRNLNHLTNQYLDDSARSAALAKAREYLSENFDQTGAITNPKNKKVLNTFGQMVEEVITGKKSKVALDVKPKTVPKSQPEPVVVPQIILPDSAKLIDSTYVARQFRDAAEMIDAGVDQAKLHELMNLTRRVKELLNENKQKVEKE